MADRKGGKQPWKRKPESDENRSERKKSDRDQEKRTGRSEDFYKNRRGGKFEERPEGKRYGKPDDRGEKGKPGKFDGRPERNKFRKFEDRNETGNQRKFEDKPGRNQTWKSGDRPEKRRQDSIEERPGWKRPENNRSRPERKDSRDFEEKTGRKGYGFKEKADRKRFDNSDERTERKRFGNYDDRSGNKRFDNSGERPARKRFDSPGERPERKRFNSFDERPERRKFDTSGERSEEKRYDKAGRKDSRNRYGRMEEKPEKSRHGKFDSRREEAVTEEKPFVLFAQLLLESDHDRRGRRLNTDIDVEPFAELSYEDELRKKNEAIRKFWKEHGLPLKPESVVPSPKPRNYRTTTKRRVIRVKSRFHLAFSTDLRNVSDKVFVPSPLETEEHSGIYSYIAGRINEPVYNIIGSILNFVIIRGSYSEFAVIFNVRKLTGPAVRKIKALAEELKEKEPRIISSFIYLDPSESDYYLESFRPQDQISFKKLFGPDRLFVRFDDRTYSFHPTGFSQVNQSMIPVMLKKAQSMLLPAESSSFIDLYCGYGLFALYFADHFEETLGIEAEGNSIRSAIENKSHIKTEGKVRFTAKRITAETLEDVLPENYTSEVYLLDPPRQGTEKGVIKEIARRMPEKALHIFCNVDRIPLELKEWKKNNYMIHKVVPLDMFPGTPNLEVLILLKRR